MIEATTGGSNQQNNATSIENTGEGYFSHFSIIEVNLFGRFEAFRGNNNNPPLGNNNNNNPSLLPLSEFEGELGGGFNLLGGNAGELDSNIAALVNALIGANLKINYVERESNHVKPTEFEETEAEDPNE